MNMYNSHQTLLHMYIMVVSIPKSNISKKKRENNSLRVANKQRKMVNK